MTRHTLIVCSCRCRAAFCFNCGLRWKTCSCAHFDEHRLLARAEEILIRRRREEPVPVGGRLAIEAPGVNGNHVLDENQLAIEGPPAVEERSAEGGSVADDGMNEPVAEEVPQVEESTSDETVAEETPTLDIEELDQGAEFQDFQAEDVESKAANDETESEHLQKQQSLSGIAFEDDGLRSPTQEDRRITLWPGDSGPSSEPLNLAEIEKWGILDHLRKYHDCTHERWKFIPGRHQCEECYKHLPQYIFECRGCLTRACNRCRRNRL